MFTAETQSRRAAEENQNSLRSLLPLRANLKEDAPSALTPDFVLPLSYSAPLRLCGELVFP